MMPPVREVWALVGATNGSGSRAGGRGGEEKLTLGVGPSENLPNADVTLSASSSVAVSSSSTEAVSSSSIVAVAVSASAVVVSSAAMVSCAC